MRVDANVKDKQRLVAGTYPSEIINAKEMVGKNAPNNNMVMIEWKTLDGPEYENGEPSEGHELTEFVTVTFEGREGGVLRMMVDKYQIFVAGIGKTVEEFAEMEAEDLIGIQANLLVKDTVDKRTGNVVSNIENYGPIVE